MSTCILSTKENIVYSFEWFKGLLNVGDKDTGWTEGDYSSDKNVYLRNIKKYGKHIEFYEGDAVINIKKIKEFDFAFVDLDLYEPTLEIFKYLDSIAKSGDILITHDYGAKSIIEATVMFKNKSNIRFKQKGNLGIFEYI